MSDLIAQRAKIKSAIVASNAVTKVTVAGKEMTVAEAIERKASISYEQNLLGVLRSQFGQVSNEFAAQQTRMEKEISEKQAQLVGRETNTKITPEEMKVLTDLVAQRENPAMIDPLDLDSKIKTFTDEINAFLEEVDSALNESNAITKIEV